MAYDVVVRTRGMTYTKPGMPALEDARGYVEDSLACWGVPFPPSLSPQAFEEVLAETGEYHHEAEDRDTKITVTRTPKRP